MRLSNIFEIFLALFFIISLIWHISVGGGISLLVLIVFAIIMVCVMQHGISLPISKGDIMMRI